MSKSLEFAPLGGALGKVCLQLPNTNATDFDFSRNSEATLINKDGILETVGQNIPRYTYEPDGCPVLLTEPQSTNEILWSEDFTQASWGKNNIILTPSYSVDILKGKTSTLLTTNATTSNSISASISVANSTHSFVVKKGNHNYFQILDFGSTQMYANFDIVNLTLGTQGNLSNSTITDLGNGWVKISTTFTGSNTSSRLYFASSNSDSYGGGTVSIGLTVELSHVQVEQLPYATSYIKTEGTTITRVSDVVSSTNQDLFNFGTSDFSIVSKFKRKSGVAQSIFRKQLDTSNLVHLYWLSSGVIYFRVMVGGVLYGFNTNVTDIDGDVNLALVSDRDGDYYQLTINGSLISLIGVTPLTTSSISNTGNTLIGSDDGSIFYQKLKSFSLYKSALSPSEAVTLTTL